MATVKQLNQHWTDLYFHLHIQHQEKISHQVIRVLQLVEKREEVGVKDVADLHSVTHHTASEHVKRIIEKGYLLKKRNPQDERKVILELTERGREGLFRNTSLDEDKLQAALDLMTPEERATVSEAFRLLSEKAKSCTSS
ncbi:MarR family winged helix-turn-helix transcriptional regulator [Rossellomorea marisflavi]|uniref:MarR family winged helix-turn-helix transcriptional regulator n=1 Tax=Rossellomorea marisflavi TaxID=189381 RepID=UPI003513E6FB